MFLSLQRKIWIKIRIIYDICVVIFMYCKLYKNVMVLDRLFMNVLTVAGACLTLLYFLISQQFNTIFFHSIFIDVLLLSCNCIFLGTSVIHIIVIFGQIGEIVLSTLHKFSRNSYWH